MQAGLGRQQQQHQQRWQKQRHVQAAAAAVSIILLLACSHTAGAVLLSQRPGNVLTMILTDCGKYQDWQTIAAAFAWRQSGQPGSVIRVANCNEQDTKKYDPTMLDYVQTHMAKQYAYYEPLKDWYAAYNKPGAVVDYFEHHSPKEEWVVVLDSDMLLKTPFLPEELPLERGWAYAAHYDYLSGVNNQLAMRHVPEITPRNDTFGGPLGRRGDRVGGPYYMHRDDLRKLAPQWLNYTYIMRNDTEAYADSGDTASKKGDRIWIAEMYGYSFGAAKSDVWHKWHNDFMLYPSYSPSYVPHVMHYGLIYKVGDWEYDKHWYFDFDVHKCPPWTGLDGKPKAGIFPPPPYPDKLPNKDYLTQYKDLLAISVISVVNAAICDYHVRNCAPHPQLTAVCDEAFKLYHAIDTQLKDYEWRWNCTDHNKECKMWAERGECKNSKQYMLDHCKESCKYCTARGPRPKDDVELHPLSVAAISKEVGVTPAQPDSRDAAPATAAGGAVGADAAAAAEAAKAKAAIEKLTAEKAASEKAAAAAQAAAETATKAAAAAKAAAEQATAAKAAEGGPSEADLRAKWPASTLSYATLVKRCTELKDLDDAGLKHCLKAASYKLLYAGSAADGAALASGGQQQPQQLKDSSDGGYPRGPHPHDLAAMHSKFEEGKSKVNNMLSRTVVAEGTWGFAEQALVVVGVLAVAVFVYGRLRGYRAGRAKDHRSE